ncbi:hypothetical protein C8255_22400, partial [filamentous cyanobacterium CCP3]
PIPSPAPVAPPAPLEVLPHDSTTAPPGAAQPHATLPRAAKPAPVVSTQPQPETQIALQLRWSEVGFHRQGPSTASAPYAKQAAEGPATGASYSRS